MKTTISANFKQAEDIQLLEAAAERNKSIDAFTALDRGVYASLQRYSNVHRGSGHNSIVTTHLYEQARSIVLVYLGLTKSKYYVIFCSARNAEMLRTQLNPKSYQSISSRDIGLSLGICAMAVKKKYLPAGIPFQTGGGTAKLMSKDWVIWSDAPGKFEAGTPAIINVIAFARALRMKQQSGKDLFNGGAGEKLTASELLYNDELLKYSGQELLGELRKTLIGSGLEVPTMGGKSKFINLDNSASTPTFTPIWNAFRRTLSQPAHVQQKIIQEVRAVCSIALGAPLADYDVIFTSNTTEAINLVAESYKRESNEGIKPLILNTLLEHSSNDLPWRSIPGSSLIRLQVDTYGFIDLQELETLMSHYNHKAKYGKQRIKFVAVSGASNVLGVCNNIKEISKIVHRFGARFLVDAAQLVAHRKIDMEEYGIDYLAFSAHKVYAPFGCGLLMVRKGLLNFDSEEMQQINSSGEENASGIAALGKSLLLMQRIGMDVIQNEELALTARVLRGLAQIPGLRIYGIKNTESPEFSHKIGVVVFTLKGMVSSHVAKELALRGGIGVRFGCHCAHILVKHILAVPPFLEKFQRLIQTLFPKLRLPGVVRVSLGIENSAEDVDRLIKVLSKIAGHKISFADSSLEYGTNENKILSRTVVQKQLNEFSRISEQSVYFNFKK
jgi:selenocysteine lyase/cysteine desulfurase